MERLVHKSGAVLVAGGAVVSVLGVVTGCEEESNGSTATEVRQRAESRSPTSVDDAPAPPSGGGDQGGGPSSGTAANGRDGGESSTKRASERDRSERECVPERGDGVEPGRWTKTFKPSDWYERMRWCLQGFPPYERIRLQIGRGVHDISEPMGTPSNRHVVQWAEQCVLRHTDTDLGPVEPGEQGTPVGLEICAPGSGFDVQRTRTLDGHRYELLDLSAVSNLAARLEASFRPSDIVLDGYRGPLGPFDDVVVAFTERDGYRPGVWVWRPGSGSGSSGAADGSSRSESGFSTVVDTWGKERAEAYWYRNESVLFRDLGDDGRIELLIIAHQYVESPRLDYDEQNTDWVWVVAWNPETRRFERAEELEDPFVPPTFAGSDFDYRDIDDLRTALEHLEFSR